MSSVLDIGHSYGKIVVTMTSWVKRIQNCHLVISKLLQNSLKPDIIFLNLSVQEFPNKTLDLPSNLVELVNANQNIVRINWMIIGLCDIMGDLSIPIINRNIDYERKDNHKKTIVNCHIDKSIWIGNHGIGYKNTECNDCLPNLSPANWMVDKKTNQKNNHFTQETDFSIIYLKHFRTKTLGEFLVQKLFRTDSIDSESHTNLDYFIWNNKGGKEKIDQMKHILVDMLREKMELSWDKKQV